jgi:hypothetical protein
MLRILALSVVGSAVISVLAPFVAVRASVRYAAGFALVTVLNVTLNVALLPALGGPGAAWANLGTETLLAWYLMRTGTTDAGAVTDGPDQASAGSGFSKT